jgi:hypothetical protein
MTMSKFNKEYFFLHRTDDDRIPGPTPDEDTVEKEYMYKVQPMGQKPFIFYNGALEWQQEWGIEPADPSDVLFDGADVLVREKIANKLWEEYDIPNLAIQPAIYIDHKKKWHEDFWFLTFTKDFDCWDREKSTYDPEPLGTNSPLYSVYTYSLNDKLLEDTPLPARLLFRMGGSLDGFVTVHESLADLFRVKGVDVVPITDFGVIYPE